MAERGSGTNARSGGWGLAASPQGAGRWPSWIQRANKRALRCRAPGPRAMLWVWGRRASHGGGP
eukprot:7361973-Alexandrium_andersonii.AAC.1